ncbi:MAG: UDP-glucose 4-epimerase GalE [Candidatus Cloacimonadota bacterium]|nr:MAG: UDP-glucose 4-epimerase GalE [Candidatus Cloacimonadota bacterium]PIE81107.1 MAG: UDP-glucose 4-epimerase GalE [Candidatus Delongbacteria bacterium]
MRTVLVTGGTGYIGSHTTIQLIERGDKVIIVDNLSNSKLEVLNRIEKITGTKPQFHKVDILDYEKLEEIFDKYSFDSVIHFAGLKAVGESVEKPLDYYHNNITGSLNLFKIMQKKGVFNLVFSSSATVYGDPHTVPIKEDFPISATNPYGRTKLHIEEILRDLYVSDNRFNIILLRYFNPVGAHKSGLIGEDPNGIPNNLMPFISQVSIGKLERLRVFGNDYDTHDGTGVRDYIHVVDLANGHLKALDIIDTIDSVNVINLGTGTGYSVLDVVKAYEKASGKNIPYDIVERRSGDIGSCYADPSLAKEVLNWEAKFNIEDMCIDTWRWQSKNPDGLQ